MFNKTLLIDVNDSIETSNSAQRALNIEKSRRKMLFFILKIQMLSFLRRLCKSFLISGQQKTSSLVMSTGGL